VWLWGGAVDVSGHSSGLGVAMLRCCGCDGWEQGRWGAGARTLGSCQATGNVAALCTQAPAIGVPGMPRHLLPYTCCVATLSCSRWWWKGGSWWAGGCRAGGPGPWYQGCVDTSYLSISSICWWHIHDACSLLIFRRHRRRLARGGALIVRAAGENGDYGSEGSHTNKAICVPWLPPVGGEPSRPGPLL
jgi:hypothetical protein